MANEFKIKKGLIVTGADGGTVVDIQGSQGQLFSVTDDLSGSIFAVSDISGVPILDVNSSGVSYFDGSLGIGTDSPNSKLHVLDGAAGTYTPYGESDTLVVESATPGGISLIGTGTGSASKQSIVFGTPSDVTSASILYDSNNSFLSIGTTTASNFVKFVSGNGVTALTLDASQDATFAGDVTVSGGDLNVGSGATVNSVINMLGTNNSFIEKDTGVDLYFANNVSDKDIKFRVKDDGTNVIALTIDGSEGGNSTFAAQAFSAATSSGDASSTLTTKGYVDGLITGATIYRGAWDPSGGGYGSPDLSGVTQTSGYYYICSAAGTAEPNGTGCEPDSWETGDWVIWNDDIVDCAGTGTGGWQKIDNSSVLSGVGTGQTVALWEGADSVTDSETLGNAPITVSGNNVNFADSISVADSARFEGTTSPITIGDGFGYGGSATICKHNGPLYLQYNNGLANTDLVLGGNGTAVRLQDATSNYMFTADGISDSFVVGQGGDFGVGVTNPNATLHVKNNEAGITARIQQGADGEESAIRFQTLDGNNSRYTDIAQNAVTGNLDIRVPYNATTPNLTIKNGGDVGINISDPQTQLHISGGTPSPNSTAITSTTIGLAISGNDGLMDLLSYDDNTTVATSIGMGRYNQTTGDLIDKWGLVTWYDTGDEGSNLSEKISLHYGTNGTPWSSTEMVTVLRDGNVGIGTNTPFTNASDNNGLNIDRGGHSSLLIGDGVNDGGMIQSSDNSQRIIIGANVYDSPTGSWSRFTADSAALIDVYGEGTQAFISLNVDNGTEGFPAARLTVSNTGGIQFNTYGGTNKTGTPTYLLGTDVSGNIVKTLPYVPSAGTTQFFNQSNLYNNTTPGVTGYGNVVMDTSVSYYDTGKNVVVGTRGMVWTGKHYIFTDHTGKTAKFYNNNFDLITNPEASTITLPEPSSGGHSPHGAAWDGRYLYCVTYSPMKIVAYNLDNGTTTATLVSETDISSYSTVTYAIEYAEGHLYTCADGKVSKFKVEGKTITHVFTSGVILSTIDAQAITYDGSYLWFTQNGQNAYKVSLDCVLVATITTGLPPNNIGWAWNGQNVATVNYTTGDVYILNTAETRFDTEEFLVMGGNVGIGTTSPLNKTHIIGPTLSTGTETSYGLAVSDVGDETKTLILGYDLVNDVGIIQAIDQQTAWKNLAFGISGNSKVGIGTVSPISKLEISGPTGSYLSGIGFSATGTGARTYRTYIGTNGYFYFDDVTGGSSRLTIDTVGNVGIGTTNPRDTLEIEGNMRFVEGEDHLMIKPNSNIHGADFIVGDGVAATDTPVMSLNGLYGGKVTIQTTVGTSSLADKTAFDIQGTQGQLFSVTDDLSGSIFAVADISGVPIFDVNSSGLSTFDGNVAIKNGKKLFFNNAINTASGSIVCPGGGSLALQAYGNDMIYLNENSDIRFSTSSSEKMRIDSAGNVGIGTTSNSAEETNNGVPKLQVTTATAPLGEFPLAARFTTASDAGDNSGVSVLINSGNDRGLMISAGRAVDNRSRATLNLVSFDGTELIDGLSLYMPNTGSTGATTGTNVGIGTTSPGSKLEIAGDTSNALLTLRSYSGGSNDAFMRFFEEGNGDSYSMGLDSSDGKFKIAHDTDGDSLTSGTKMVIQTNGNVGIGDSTPSYKLDVNGTIRATGDVIAYSDARVKDNVVTIGNALEKVTQLRGVSYTRNDVEDTTTKIGVIAQEVLEVLPEVVQEDDEGKYSVAYGNMVGLLIESIKELKAEIEELKKQIK